MSRLRKKRGFATIANSTCQTAKLSLQAKGFLALLLSLPDDWEYNFDALVTMSNNGHHSTRNAMNELTAQGYLSKEPIKNNDTGKFEGWDWIVSDEPLTVVTETIMTETRSTDERDDNTKKNSTKKNNKEYPHTPKDDTRLLDAQKRLIEGTENSFNAFKRQYPKAFEVYDEIARVRRYGYAEKQAQAKQLLKQIDTHGELAFIDAAEKTLLAIGDLTNPIAYLITQLKTAQPQVPAKRLPKPNQIWLEEQNRLFLVKSITGNTVHGILKHHDESKQEIDLPLERLIRFEYDYAN